MPQPGRESAEADWLRGIASLHLHLDTSASPPSLHLPARVGNGKPMEGCRDAVHKEN